MILRPVAEITFAAAVPVAVAAMGALSEPNTLFAWLAVVLVAALLIYIVVKIVQAIRNPGSDVAAMERRIDARQQNEVAEMERRIDGRRSVSIAGLHARINQVEHDLKDDLGAQNTVLASVKTTAEMTNQRSIQMETKLDRVIEHMPRRRLPLP